MKQKKAWRFFSEPGEGIYVSHCSAKCMWHDARAGKWFSQWWYGKVNSISGYSIIKTILDFIVSLGLFAFVNLPVLFAIAIPLGLLKDKEDKAYGAFLA